jgi:hypothetical protein
MFLPIATLAKVKNQEEAMKYANDMDYGLTAGFYGNQEEIDRCYGCQPFAKGYYWFMDGLSAIWRLERFWLIRQECGRLTCNST